MKIRTGFISNSSTSFAIFGLTFNSLKNLAKVLDIKYSDKIEGCQCKFDRTICKFCPNCGSKAYVQNNIEDDDLFNKIYEKLLINDIEIKNCSHYGDKIYVGNIIAGDYEVKIGTGSQSLNKLQITNNKLLELFGEEGKFQNVYISE
jgi:hypothetical protein